MQNIAALPLTISLCRLIGLSTLPPSLAMFFYRRSVAKILSEMVHDRPALYIFVLIMGLLSLSAGLAIVLAHNIWSGGVLPVVVTLCGWGMLIRGLPSLLVPPDTTASYFAQTNVEMFFSIAGAIVFVLGAYLTDVGFRPQRL